MSVASRRRRKSGRSTASYLADIRRDWCVYCQKNQGRTLDHIVPRASGGSDGILNLAPSCLVCNQKKGDQSLLAFLVATRAAVRHRPPTARRVTMRREIP